MEKPDVKNWLLSDGSNFESGIEPDNTHDGGECVYLKSTTSNPKEIGFISKSILPGPFLGKRLRMSARIKTELPVRSSVQLWLRVDGDWKDKSAYFDNMFEQRISRVTDWAQYHVEVDVPILSKAIVFGVLLSGPGKLLFNDVVLESIEVPPVR
jgi:hypothetical protein